MGKLAISTSYSWNILGIYQDYSCPAVTLIGKNVPVFNYIFYMHHGAGHQNENLLKVHLKSKVAF